MRRILTLAAILFSSIAAFADGTVSGIITDAKTTEPLIGVTVKVKGATVGAVTDVEGRFSMTIPAGQYELEVRYIGYDTKEVADVAVKDGEVSPVNLTLSETTKSKEIGEVTVRATVKRESINALYTMQRNAVSVSSGISADVIARSPDRNTGEILKRVSGASVQNNRYVVVRGLAERYNIAMINNALLPSTEPDRKAFSFDVIPSNLIDNLIINKTASADLPGDFAGGIITVLTRDVPERNFFSAGVGLGYNSQSTFRDFKQNPRSTSEYFGFAPQQNTKLPEAFGNDYRDYAGLQTDQQLSIARQLNNNFTTNLTSALPGGALNLAGGYVKKFGPDGGKLGIIASVALRSSMTIVPEFERGLYEGTAVLNRRFTDVQYRFGSGLSGLLNVSYVAGKNKFSLKNLYNKLYDATYYERAGFITSANQQIQLYSTVPSDRSIYNTQLEGEHAFGKKSYKLAWNLNYANVGFSQQDLRTAYYSRSAAFDDQGLNPLVQDGTRYIINDRNSRRFFINQRDNNYGGNLAFTAPFEIGGAKQSVKVGYLGLYKTRDFGARIFQHRPGRAAIEENLYKPADQIFDPSNYSEQGLELEEIVDPTYTYDANSFLNAAYILFDNSFAEKWRLTWGGRFENYEQELLTRTRSSVTEPVSDVRTFRDFLPSFNLSYNHSEKTKVRLSGSRTVNRPEFREIAPFSFLDFENLWEFRGNPDLQRAQITNADLRYEWYPAAGEVFSIGGFFKHFKNPIEAQLPPDNNLDLFRITYTNAPSAVAVGAELEARKTLSFLGDAKWLENFTVASNLTYIYSRVDINQEGAEDRPLQGQSPYLLNASLLYNDARTGLGISALYNRVGQRIALVGNGEIPNTWERGRDIIDLQLGKRVMKGKGEIKLTVGDLLNQAFVLYWNTNDKNTYQEGDDVLGRNGTNDQIFQRYKLGTNVSLGFGYTF